MDQGITDEYIGEVDVGNYNIRAEHQYLHLRKPKPTVEKKSSIRNARIKYAQMD